MNRFARVLVIAMMAVVLGAALTSVSAADAGKPGTTATVQRQGVLAPGHLRQVGVTVSQGNDYEFFGQYFDWYRFYVYLYWNSKLQFKL